MRLAVFTNQFPGKVNTFLARDMACLLRAGIDITIFPLYPHDNNLWKFVPNILFNSNFDKSKVIHVTLNDMLINIKHNLFNIVFLKDLLLIIKSAINFGLIQTIKSIYTALIGLFIFLKYNNRFDHVLAYWGNYAATAAYIYHRLNNKNIPFSIFFHAGTDLYRDQIYLEEKINYCDNIITVSDFNQKYITNLMKNNNIGSHIYVHHLGINLEEFKFTPYNRQNNKIIGVGSLTKSKGYDYLLRAAAILISRGLDIEIELIGEGDQYNYLNKLSRKLNIDKRITFRGLLTFSEVKKAMLTATFLVHPSPEIGDNVPTVIKEALALGTPVIASDIAGIPELLNYGDCGILIPPKNESALAEAMLSLLKKSELREILSFKGRQFVENKFNLWNNGRKLSQLLFNTKRKQMAN